MTKRKEATPDLIDLLLADYKKPEDLPDGFAADFLQVRQAASMHKAILRSSLA